MNINELIDNLEYTFKYAYNLGQKDSLEGAFICNDVLFKHFLVNNKLSLASPEKASLSDSSLKLKLQHEISSIK